VGVGGCEIRTREGLPPTRFPTMLASVHRRPPPYVSWADRDGWVSADTREPRRMRPHLRPAGPAGRCRQRGPHPAACTVPVLACSSGGSRGLTALDDAEPAVTIACWLICPAQVSQAPGSHGVTGGSARPTHTQRRIGAAVSCGGCAGRGTHIIPPAHGGTFCQESVVGWPGDLLWAAGLGGGGRCWLSSQLLVSCRRAAGVKLERPQRERPFGARARTNELDAGKRWPMIGSEERACRLWLPG
jgi:hypothetical protein